MPRPASRGDDWQIFCLVTEAECGAGASSRNRRETAVTRPGQSHSHPLNWDRILGWWWVIARLVG